MSSSSSSCSSSPSSSSSSWPYRQLLPIKTLSTDTVYRSGKWCSIAHHHVQIPHPHQSSPSSPSYTDIPDWSFISSPSFINVAARTTDHQWILFNQSKYAVSYSFHGAQSLATVGGYIEEKDQQSSTHSPEVSALLTAKRELLEETGYSSSHWVFLSSTVPDANRGCGIGYLFLAYDCVLEKKDEAIVSDDLEEQEILFFNDQQLEDSLLKNEFRVTSWAATCSLALMKYKQIQREQEKEQQKQ